MRLAVFYLTLFVLQSFSGALLGDRPAPDFFLIAMLTLLGRIPLWQLLLAGYGIGLLQDLSGHGVLGVHAMGLAIGAYVASIARAQMSGQGLIERLLMLLAAQAGKWLTFLLLVAWLAGPPPVWTDLGVTFVLETLLTAAAGLLIVPWAHALMDRGKVLAEDYL
jgi:rod shape-determining protein MreD